MLLDYGPGQGETDARLLVRIYCRGECLVDKGLLGAAALVGDLDQEIGSILGEPGAQPQPSPVLRQRGQGVAQQISHRLAQLQAVHDRMVNLWRYL